MPQAEPQLPVHETGFVDELLGLFGKHIARAAAPHIVSEIEQALKRQFDERERFVEVATHAVAEVVPSLQAVIERVRSEGEQTQTQAFPTDAVADAVAKSLIQYLEEQEVPNRQGKPTLLSIGDLAEELHKQLSEAVEANEGDQRDLLTSYGIELSRLLPLLKRLLSKQEEEAMSHDTASRLDRQLGVILKRALNGTPEDRDEFTRRYGRLGRHVPALEVLTRDDREGRENAVALLARS
ncbi:MAG: hypothetical protein HYT10_01560 [Candidatus Levybacteria bacterium]|nr:hypothetical protein [Candidatus Levybacteria bacterium]